jgi:hypothetical protein
MAEMKAAALRVTPPYSLNGSSAGGFDALGRSP